MIGIAKSVLIIWQFQSWALIGDEKFVRKIIKIIIENGGCEWNNKTEKLMADIYNRLEAKIEELKF